MFKLVLLELFHEQVCLRWLSLAIDNRWPIIVAPLQTIFSVGISGWKVALMIASLRIVMQKRYPVLSVW
jgi:hypothetical protein